MKRNQKLIIAIVLVIFVALSGSLVAWFFFFRDFPHDEIIYYPDLTISDYSLENDNLTVEISNIGDLDTTGVIIIAEIDSLDLTLYNNSQTPLNLDINEVFIFSIDLSDYKLYFTSGNTYTINIQADPDDDIPEESENNNEINVDYYYEAAPPLLSLFPPNTYSLNSTIDTFGYAVVFNASQIMLEDSLIITNGTINGYTVVNSTILKNTTIINSDVSISIALYGAQNLTIRNIWNSKLSVVLCDKSKLSLINCSILQVIITASNHIFVSNSSIEIINTIQTPMNISSLKFTDYSSINYCIISGPTSLEIEYTSIHNLLLFASTNPYTQQKDYLVIGHIKNCSIYRIHGYGQTNLDIYNTDIYQFNLMGNSKLNLVECIITEAYVYQHALCTLNNSKVLSELNYGIIISSGSVNITNGVIQGTSYINNTLLINTNVSKTTLMTVVVNNTGQVLISNFSCNSFLYDNANLIITDTNPASSDSYGIYLEGSSKFTGINSSFGFIICQENSSIDLSEDCFIQSVFIDSMNNIKIKNCTFDSIAWYSEPLAGYSAEIINSTVEIFQAPPSSKVSIINCSIEYLYEGIKFQSGVNIYNSSGIFGGGSILNYLNISGSEISHRTYKYIEITGDSNVLIKDLHNLFSISIESGNLMVYNCTIDSLQMQNDAIVYLDNCTSPDQGSIGLIFPSMFTPQTFTCLGDSHLYINNTKILDGNQLILYNTAQLSITHSIIFIVNIFQESRATITNSDLFIISVAATSLGDYALNLIHSTTQNLITSAWNFINPLPS